MWPGKSVEFNQKRVECGYLEGVYEEQQCLVTCINITFPKYILQPSHKQSQRYAYYASFLHFMLQNW